MDVYTFGLALGAAGLGVMGLSGLAHAHGGHHAAGRVAGRQAAHHVGHRVGHHAPALGGAARNAARHGGGAHSPRAALRGLWSLLSPRPIFSILVGFGATGLALRGLLGGGILLTAAVIGGLALEFGAVAPLWNFLVRFESAPALTLESSLGDEARAATNFDADGHGLIAVELDGRLIQLLGSLRPEDRVAGVRVRAGDIVRIDDVDPERNRCVVRPLGA